MKIISAEVIFCVLFALNYNYDWSWTKESSNMWIKTESFNANPTFDEKRNASIIHLISLSNLVKTTSCFASTVPRCMGILALFWEGITRYDTHSKKRKVKQLLCSIACKRRTNIISLTMILVAVFSNRMLTLPGLKK